MLLRSVHSKEYTVIRHWLHFKVQYGGIVLKDWLLRVTYLQTKGQTPTQRRFSFGSATLFTDSSENYWVDYQLSGILAKYAKQ